MAEMKKMKAITFQSVRKVALSEMAHPAITDPGDVIVKTANAAICGSDMHVYHGRETGIDSGTIMGHEFAGVVHEVGEAVQNLSPGDRVVSPFTVNCGKCLNCESGLTARCEKSRLYGWVENGEGLQGVHAEYVRVPMADATLVKIPHEMSWERATLLADNIPTGHFCAEMAEIRPDGLYAVIGCGPIGLMTIMMAKYLGAEHIYAFDFYKNRLKLAESYGAIPIDASDNPETEKLLKRLPGHGFDAVMEAVGSKQSMKAAFDLLKPGGILATVGVQAYDSLPFTPPQIYDKNLILKSGRCPARYYIDKLIPILMEGTLRPEKIITHTFALEKGVHAYQLFDREKEKAIKVILKPD